MKILFLCDILEPSKSGVGDYTRWLAKTCQDMGHACSLIAFKDPSLKKNQSLKEIQSGIPALRFGNAWHSKNTIDILNTFINEHDPDWISLQFVPYSFHPKGIIYQLPQQWSALKLNRAKLHVMFHEIWIGCEGKQASVKSFLYGKIQKYFMKRFFNRVKPLLTHTHVPLYIENLTKIGLQAKRLPLFSNIPPSSENSSIWLTSFLEHYNYNLTQNKRKDLWIFGIFGTFHPSWPTEPLTTYLKEAANLHKKKILILSIGHIGSGEKLWKQWSSQNSNHIKWIKLGNLETHEISKLFHEIDFGIATSLYSLIPKSCSVISLLENGVPVIVNRLEHQSHGIKHPLLYKMTSDLSNLLPSIKRQKAHWTLKDVANQFMTDLTECL